MFANLLAAAIIALIVYLVGTLFDKTPDNRYAGIAGLVTFVALFLGYATV